MTAGMTGGCRPGHGFVNGPAFGTMARVPFPSPAAVLPRILIDTSVWVEHLERYLSSVAPVILLRDAVCPHAGFSGAVALAVRNSTMATVLVVHDAVFVESDHACDCAARDLLDHQHVFLIDSSQIEVPVAQRYLQFDALWEETHFCEDAGALLYDVRFALLTRKSGVHPKVPGVFDDDLPGVAARPDSDEFRVFGRLAFVSFGCPAGSWGSDTGCQ